MKNQIANAITVLRVLMVPVLVYLLLAGEHRAALWVFAAAGVSDALDGFIARHFNQFSRFGAILDPIADKSLIGATVLTLAWLGLIPLWLVAVVVGAGSGHPGRRHQLSRLGGSVRHGTHAPGQAAPFPRSLCWWRC